MMELDSTSSSIPIPSEQPEQVKAITYMDNDLFKVATACDMELFNKYQGGLDCLVDARQNTALHICCRNGGRRFLKDQLFTKKRFEREGSMKFLERLVDECPSLLMQPNDKGEIPLHIAAKNGYSDIVKFIIERTKLLQHDDLEKGLEATRMKQMLRMTDKEENTAYHKAVESGNLDVVLLLKELDPNFSFSANKRGATPLYIAARKGHHSLMDEILLCNPEPKVYDGPHGTTALHAAVLAKDEKTVRKLIDATERQLTKKTDDKGRTPLHYAAHFGYLPVAKLLLENDASAACIRDKDKGMSALQMAAWRGQRGTMEEIISHCPGCCEMVDNRGWNFLHFAVVTLEPSELKRFFLGVKFDDLTMRNLFDEMDVNGYTPLHLLNVGPASQLPGYVRLTLFLSKKLGVSESKFDDIQISIQQKKHVRELLNEIGNNAELEGLPVHNSFRRKVVEEEDVSMIEFLEKATEAHLLVAALVATVSFAAGFTVPGGYKSDKQGDATLSHDPAFKAFIITDTLAFVSSLLAILLHFLMTLYMKETLVRFRVRVILLADFLTFSAMVAMVIAFGTGTYAVLQSSLEFAVATLSLGLTFFPGLLIVCVLVLCFII